MNALFKRISVKYGLFKICHMYLNTSSVKYLNAVVSHLQSCIYHKTCVTCAVWWEFTALLTAELWGLNSAVTATFGINLCYLFSNKRRWSGNHCSAGFDKQTAGDVSHPDVECPGTVPWGILWLAAPPWPCSSWVCSLPSVTSPWAHSLLQGCCARGNSWMEISGMLLQCCVLPSNGAQHWHSSCQGWGMGSVRSSQVKIC